jgi:hypothetical protein
MAATSDPRVMKPGAAAMCGIAQSLLKGLIRVDFMAKGAWEIGQEILMLVISVLHAEMVKALEKTKMHPFLVIFLTEVLVTPGMLLPIFAQDWIGLIRYMFDRVAGFLPAIFPDISPLIMYAVETVLEELFAVIFSSIFKDHPASAELALFQQKQGKQRFQDFLQSQVTNDGATDKSEEEEEWIKVYGTLTVYIFGNAFTLLGAVFGTKGLKVSVLDVEVWPEFKGAELLKEAQKAVEQIADDLANHDSSPLKKLRSNGVIGSPIPELVGLCRTPWAHNPGYKPKVESLSQQVHCDDNGKNCQSNGQIAVEAAVAAASDDGTPEGAAATKPFYNVQDNQPSKPKKKNLIKGVHMRSCCRDRGPCQWKRMAPSLATGTIK